MKPHHAILLSASFFSALFFGFSLTNGIDSTKMIYLFAVSSAVMVSSSCSIFKVRKAPSFSVNSIDIIIIIAGVSVLMRSLTISRTTFITPSLALLLYFLFRVCVSSQKNTRGMQIFLGAFLLAGILQSIVALLQLYGLLPSLNPFFKMTGTFGNPDALAGYLTSITPFAFGIYLFTENAHLKKASAAFLILAILIIPATMIRNSWIAISLSGIYLLYQKYHASIRNFLSPAFKKWTVVSATIILCSLLVYGLYQLRPDSVHGRFLIWKITAKMISAHPILGMGFDRYGVEYGNYQADYFANHPHNDYEIYLAGNVNHAHNDYLEITSEFGIIGLLLFSTLLFLLLKTKNPKEAKLLIPAKASLHGIMFFMMGSFPLHILPTLINFIFIAALISNAREPILSLKPPPLLSKAMAILLFAAGILLFSHTLKIYRIDKLWHHAVQGSLQQRYDEANALFVQLYPILNKNGQFLLNYGGTLSLKGDHQLAIVILQKAGLSYTDPNIYISLGNSYASLGKTSEAEKNFWHAYHMIPNRLYPLYLLTKLYIENNLLEKAHETGHRVIHFKEKVPSPAIVEMKAEIRALLKKKDLFVQHPSPSS